MAFLVSKPLGSASHAASVAQGFPSSSLSVWTWQQRVCWKPKALNKIVKKMAKRWARERMVSQRTALVIHGHRKRCSNVIEHPCWCADVCQDAHGLSLRCVFCVDGGGEKWWVQWLARLCNTDISDFIGPVAADPWHPLTETQTCQLPAFPFFRNTMVILLLVSTTVTLACGSLVIFLKQKWGHRAAGCYLGDRGCSLT